MDSVSHVHSHPFKKKSGGTVDSKGGFNKTQQELACLIDTSGRLFTLGGTHL